MFTLQPMRAPKCKFCGGERWYGKPHECREAGSPKRAPKTEGSSVPKSAAGAERGVFAEKAAKAPEAATDPASFTSKRGRPKSDKPFDRAAYMRQYRAKQKATE